MAITILQSELISITKGYPRMDHNNEYKILKVFFLDSIKF